MENEKKFDLLKQVNTLMGVGAIAWNSDEMNDEDFEIVNVIMNSKVEDLPGIFNEVLATITKELPEEHRKMKLKDVMKEISNMISTEL